MGPVVDFSGYLRQSIQLEDLLIFFLCQFVHVDVLILAEQLSHADLIWVPKLHLEAHWIPGQHALLNDCVGAKLLRVKPDLIIKDNKVLSTDEIVDFFIALADDSFWAVVRMAAIKGNNEKLSRVRVVISSDHHVPFICA